MEFRILGPMEVEHAGRLIGVSRRRERSLLGVLLLAAGTAVSGERLAELLWDDQPPDSARATLRTHLSRLRALLAGADGDGVSLVHTKGGYLAHVDTDAVDALRFRDLLDRARTTVQPAGRARLLREALGLWRGPLLADAASPRLRERLGAWWSEARLAALDDAIEAELACGRHRDVIGELNTLCQEHPHRERFVGLLMVALCRAGRQADALAAFRQADHRLRTELGIEPGPDLRELHRRVLAADSNLLVRRPPAIADGPVGDAAPVAVGSVPRQRVPDTNPAIEVAPPIPQGGSTGPVVIPRQLPPAPRWFTGRAKELAALSSSMDAGTGVGETVVISAIGGVSGVGKTSLALHWAHRNAARFPDGHLFVNLRGFDPSGTPMSVSTAVGCLLQGLGVSAGTIPPDLDARLGLYRSVVAGRRMLILLDNAANTAQVSPLLPGSPQCTVLITSRDRLAGLVSTRGAQALGVDMLPDADARALLAERLGEDRLAAEPDAVADLVACCAGLPLALSVVAGQAQEQPDFPLSAVAASLRDASGRLSALDDDATASVRTCLSWSYSALSGTQARVFCLLGLAPGPDISLAAAANLTGLDFTQARAALRGLVRVSLLHQPAPDRYRLHDLVRLYATEQAAHELDAESRRDALLRLVDFYTHSAHHGERLLDPSRPLITLNEPSPDVRPLAHRDRAAALTWFTVEHECLLATQQLTLAERWHTRSWLLAWTLGTFHWRQGYLRDNTATWQAALASAQHLGEPAYITQAHRRLGLAHARDGDHDEAIDELRQAMECAARAGDVTEQAENHVSLAWVWAGQGDDAQALRHAERALDLWRSADVPVSAAYALSLVGWYHARLGQYTRATDCCEAALVALRHHDDREGQADTLDSLGYVALRTGRPAEAVRHFRQALELLQDLGHAYAEASTRAELGDAHHALGQDAQARRAWQSALTLYLSQHRQSDASRIERQLADQCE